MDAFLRDFQYAMRALRKTPAVAAVAVLALTLGIGLTATMWSIVYGALIRGLPFERPEQIVAVMRTNPSQGASRMPTPIHDYTDWVAVQRSFTGLAAYFTGTVNVSGTERSERLDGAFVTANTFQLLGARPVLGRTFRPGEDAPSAEPVVVIGHSVWRDRYAGDPGVIGRTLRANGIPMTIIGVMPETFEFPVNQAIWVPLRMDPVALKRGDGMSLEVFGRLRDGVSIDQAAVELAGVAKRIAADHPKTNENVGVRVDPFAKQFVGDEPTALLYTMLGAVFFVLLIACANVANLLLGRAVQRSREVGIRTALGASRAAIVRQFLAESFVLSLAGAVLGTVVAYAGVRAFNAAIAGTDPPYWLKFSIDLPVLGFVLLVALLATVVSGVIPATQASRVNLNEILKDESRGSSSFRLGRMSRALVMFEVALSCGLLVGAGLMIKSVTNLRKVDMGFGTRDVFTARVGLPEASYNDLAKQADFFDRLEAQLANLPGGPTVGLTTNLPGLGSNYEPFGLDGVAYAKDADFPRSHRVTVSPGFFAAFGARSALQGRLLNGGDRANALPVAVVNQSFARKYFQGASPVGRRVRFGTAASEQQWLTIVGVVPDLYADEVANTQPEAMYLPYMQHGGRFMSIAARTRGVPGELTTPVRNAVAAVDADIPIYFVRTLAEAIARETWFYRVFGTLFMIFGVVALFLASIGLYAVMAFAVRQRTREVGVRMALGAQAVHVVRMIFRQGLTQIGVGVVLGLGLAAGVSRLLAMVLFQVEPRDPAIFAGVVLVLAATGVLACLLPARRATRVDPMVALRGE